MSEQLDRIEAMLKYIIIKPELMELAHLFQSYSQRAQYTNTPPPDKHLYDRYEQLKNALPKLDVLTVFKKS